MSKDIVNMVGNLIVQVQNEKKERYDTCGCTSCQQRAEAVETWLNSGDLPTVIHNKTHHKIQSAETITSWLCHSCLRIATSSSGRCKFCGESRL